MARVADLDCSDGRPAVDLMAGQNRILEMIATGAALEDVLTSLTLLMESQVEGMLCSILLLDRDGRLRHGAAPSLPEPYNSSIEGAMSGPKAGSCGTAAYRREQVIVADILEDPLWDDYREVATCNGLRACWSTPFFSRRGKVLGTFAMYYLNPRVPRPSETQLIEVATRIASIAVERWQGDLDRQNTHAALQKAEEKYRTIFEEAMIGIFQTEPIGRYVTVNPALARMLGYDSPADLTSSVTDVATQIYVNPRRRDEFRQLMEEHGRVQNFECQVFRKNGTKMWVLVNARAIRQGGRIVAYEGMNEDITQRKFLEQQLLHAQKMEAVGQLAGGIAHDFNNILGVILGHSELLLQRLPADDPLRRRIDQICLASRRAVSLTGQLLAFSRRQMLRPVVLDLNTVVANVTDMLARLIGENIQVVTHLDEALGPVKADAGQMEQVLLNLALNARDAMPQGGTLTIETSNVSIDQVAQRHAGAKQGCYTMIVVSDTGIGMDEKTLARIFDPFFTTKEQGKGTGLGLATAYGVVKQSGGYISVSSELEHGTTFQIYLPRTEQPVEKETRHVLPTASARNGETILLVEDAAALREITREFLEDSGYRILQASDGEEALTVAEQYKATISLMITDVVMPGMNGRALAERLLAARPEMKVLYVSGYTDDAIFRQGILPSRTDFLHKPYTQQDLAGKLRELLSDAE